MNWSSIYFAPKKSLFISNILCIVHDRLKPYVQLLTKFIAPTPVFPLNSIIALSPKHCHYAMIRISHFIEPMFVSSDSNLYSLGCWQNVWANSLHFRHGFKLVIYICPPAMLFQWAEGAYNYPKFITHV